MPTLTTTRISSGDSVYRAALPVRGSCSCSCIRVLLPLLPAGIPSAGSQCWDHKMGVRRLEDGSGSGSASQLGWDGMASPEMEMEMKILGSRAGAHQRSYRSVVPRRAGFVEAGWDGMECVARRRERDTRVRGDGWLGGRMEKARVAKARNRRAASPAHSAPLYSSTGGHGVVQTPTLTSTHARFRQSACVAVRMRAFAPAEYQYGPESRRLPVPLCDSESHSTRGRRACVRHWPLIRLLCILCGRA
ncbi:hypothetical protein B0H11DRAFT_1009259 [Mycena galericulata]|nr:hypothetical protein B0H11DRAFT_1009259 [Mycena galericulata]